MATKWPVREDHDSDLDDVLRLCDSTSRDQSSVSWNAWTVRFSPMA
jgi:hypothetical protein